MKKIKKSSIKPSVKPLVKLPVKPSVKPKRAYEKLGFSTVKFQEI